MIQSLFFFQKRSRKLMYQKKRRWKFQKLFRGNQQGSLFRQRCTDQVERLFRDIHVCTHRNLITIQILFDIAAAADVQREEEEGQDAEGAEGAEDPGGFSSGEEMLRKFLSE